MSIKNWEKFNESHWADIIKNQVSWSRDYEIGELFYDLQDMGFKNPVITHKICDDNFNHPGKKIDHLYSKLYTGYTIVCADSISRRRNKVKENIQIYENLITLLNRVRQMGFKIEYDYNGTINMSLYHPNDVIDKGIYIKDEVKSKIKRKIGLDRVEETLRETLSKIADVTSSLINLRDLSVTKNVIFISSKSDKYSSQTILSIVNKILKPSIDSGLYQTKVFGDNVLIGDPETLSRFTKVGDPIEGAD